MAASCTPASPTVLVVDDDPAVAGLLTRYLGGRGMRVEVASSLAGLRRALATSAFDAMLLDLGLPDGDGLTALSEVRAVWSGPVLILSGRSETVEHVLGLESGADDFVDKPFDLRELLARLNAALRRGAPPRTDAELSIDGLRVNLARRTVTGRDGAPLALTEGEFDVLAVLLRHPLQPVSRDALMSQTRGRQAGPFDRAIDVQVARLRQKVERDPARPALVCSVRGVGYRLAEVPTSVVA
ncbi:DNA-binding response regulator [Lysobacter sp. TY2-98]|uniref:response regulator n=1 Tax=Lysobacter sp. TY2-98 TaxID=2290922 RepID=UPI000E1FB6FE|nr:response regulator transcription factor [Lysobacter sp. TY2-98]AXK71057.1 DNA-binding response regulator [Lysobacter sp. TY2-98]